MFGFEAKPNHLPLPTGPYVAGATDVMLDYAQDGVFMRIYYPTSASKNDPDNYRKWIPWMIDSSYADGIASVLVLPRLIVKGGMWWVGTPHIPVLYGEKIRKDDNMKCIIFSHGLGGSRFLYSFICCELASQGFVVFAVEHRDRSASNTYYYANVEHARDDRRTVVPHRLVPLNKNHYSRRNKQVHIRAKECSRLLDFILNVNAGRVPHNVLDDVVCKERDVDFELSDLVGRLDVDNLIMMGHSFGGATALLTLSQRPELKLGILMDPWMFPIKNEKLYENLDKPLLFVNTQTFHVVPNIDAMSKYFKSNQRDMYTILHTTHENQGDSVLLVGYWMNWFMKKLEPRLALRINNALLLKFTNRYLDYPKDVTEQDDLLNEQRENIEKGLTKPWS